MSNETVTQKKPDTKSTADTKPKEGAQAPSKVVSMNRNIKKTVVLKASPLFVTLPKQVQSETIVKFGSFFAKNSSAPARGLTSYEEELLLADYLGTSAKSPEFRGKAKEFWANLEIRVPIPDGRELNISHEVRKVNVTITENIAGNDVERKEQIEVRYPENLIEFCIYELAKINEKVATTEAELENRNNFEFYVEDLEAEKEKEKRRFKAQKQGLTEFTTLINDESDEATRKIKSIVNVFYDKLMKDGKYPDVSDREDCEIAIQHIYENYPNEFVSTVKDSKLKEKALLSELLQVNIFREVGGTIVDSEENIIGDNMKGAVVFLTNPSNSEKINVYKSQLKEAKK